MHLFSIHTLLYFRYNIKVVWIVVVGFNILSFFFYRLDFVIWKSGKDRIKKNIPTFYFGEPESQQIYNIWE